MSEAGEKVVHFSGRLTIDTATEIFKKSLQFTPEQNSLVIDLAKVEEVDSTAVSLMLFWLRTAKTQKVSLSFVNVPANLLSLANLYGVSDALSLTSPSK